MYFKGALFLHTLRGVVNDDERWWKLVRDVYQQFKYQNIMTEDLVRFVNAQLGQNLTPVFDQYLRRAALPTLELAFNEKEGTVAYRWDADERALRHADSRRPPRAMAGHPADDRLGGHEDGGAESSSSRWRRISTTWRSGSNEDRSLRGFPCRDAGDSGRLHRR